MAIHPSSRLLVELAPHSVQFLAMDGAGIITGYVECASESLAVSTALAQLGVGAGASQVHALIYPSPSFVLRANAQEAASIRTTKSLLARAEAAAQAEPGSCKVIAFDAATGAPVDTVGTTPWVTAVATAAQLESTTTQLDSLGLSTIADLGLAFPAQLGAVAMTLQDLPESTRVLVWQIGENDALLASISAAGCEAVATIPVGFSQLFDAVQAGLGLRFRAAATKLFFNASYDFTDAAGAIAERLAALLRPAITALGATPTTLHVVGLPTAQAWLAKALSSSLELELLSPDLPAFCAQRKLTGPGIESGMPVAALGLLLRASDRGGDEAAWVPRWLDVTTPVVPAPAAAAPAVPVKPAASSAPAVSSAMASAPAKPVLVPVPAGAAAVKPAGKVKPATAAIAKAAPAQQVKPAAVAPAIAAAKPAKSVKPESVVVAPSEEVAEPLAENNPAVELPVGPKKKPVALLAAVAAVVVLGGLGAVFFSGGSGAKTDAAPVVAAVSPEELKRREEETARLLAEEMASPRSFHNEHYSFGVSDRGYLRKLTDSSKRVLIDEFGWIELQGAYLGTGKPFTAGIMSDSDFTPSVTKTVREGKVVFEITGTHARFTLKTLITCLPTSLRLETVFTPINMTEYRGPLSLVYSVKMNRSSLALGQRGVLAPGMASFATQAGPVEMKFDPSVWGPTGEAGKQAVTVGGNLVLFEFSGAAEPKNNVLTAELVMP